MSNENPKTTIDKDISMQGIAVFDAEESRRIVGSLLKDKDFKVLVNLYRDKKEAFHWAILGFFEGVRDYDPEKANVFTKTYKNIRGRLMYGLDASRMIHIPKGMFDNPDKIRKREAESKYSFGCFDQSRKILNSKWLPIEKNPIQGREVVREDEEREENGRIAELILRMLSEKEELIVRKWFGIGEERRTIVEIGKEVGLSCNAVRKIKDRAIKRMKEKLDIGDFL